MLVRDVPKCADTERLWVGSGLGREEGREDRGQQCIQKVVLLRVVCPCDCQHLGATLCGQIVEVC